MIDQTEGYTNSECSPGFEITSVSRRCSSCKNTTIGQQFCNRKRQESGHGVRLFLTSRSTNSLLSWEWESRFKTALLHWDCYSLVPVSGRVFSWQYSGGKGKRSLLSAPSLDFLLQKCCSVFKKTKKAHPLCFSTGVTSSTSVWEAQVHVMLRETVWKRFSWVQFRSFIDESLKIKKKIYFKWSV